MDNNEFRDSWFEQFGTRNPKVICVGLNYRTHAGESGQEPPKAPLLFGKYSNALIGNGATVVLPPNPGHVDGEAELAVVIGKTASKVAQDDAFDVIAGYTCANDVSARDFQFADGQWFRGKAYDTFCPLGPTVVPASEFDPSNVRVQQRLNGEVLQDAQTADLIFPIPVLINYISNVITLERGDLILTGTPEGVGVFRDPKITLADGDVMEIEIDGIGVLRNPVRASA